MNNTKWFFIILDILFDENAFNEDFIDITPHLKIIFEKSIDKENDLNRIRMACERLENAGFAKIWPQTHLGQPYHNDYQTLDNSSIRARMTLDGFLFEVNERQQKKLNDSIIDVNNSSKALNTETATFYVHQRTTNNVHKWLTVVIFLAAAISAFVSTCSYLHTKELDQVKKEESLSNKQQLLLLQHKLEAKEEKDLLFQNAVRDSLKMPK